MPPNLWISLAVMQQCAMLDTPYLYERLDPQATALAAWTVNRARKEASGKCPKCLHDVTIEIRFTASSMAPGSIASPMTRYFECNCNNRHANGLTFEDNCGRYWFAQIQPEGDIPQLLPAPADAPFSAAVALHQAANDELPRVRTAGEKWIAGVTALLGLFGLTGVVVGKDVVASLSSTGKFFVALFLAAAVITAVIALINTYSAAYGWPSIKDVTDDESLSAWNKARLEYVSTAANAYAQASLPP